MSFVKGVKSDEDFDTFRPFLDPLRHEAYDLDSLHNFSSNPDIPTWIETFLNGTAMERQFAGLAGTQYLALYGINNGLENTDYESVGYESHVQGGYECSIRSVTQWEDYRSGFLLDHPNYYSRYMDEKVEGDGEIYSHWKGMNWRPTHHKTARLVLVADSRGHLAQEDQMHQNATKRFVYTDRGKKIVPLS